jgi:hypothetical protein
VIAIHNRDASRHLVADLAEDADGYAAPLALRHAGRWELRIDAARDSAHFVARLRRDTGEGFLP